VNNLEVKDKRTKYTKTFDIGDGEFETKTFSKPKHYKENGKWLEIDLNIKTGDGYFVEDNAIKTYFKEDPREKEVVQLDTDRGSLTYSPVSMRFSNGTDTELISEVQPSEVSIKENTINYLNEFPGVDDEFIVRADDVKDNLILKELPETTLTGEVYLEFVDVIKFDGSLVADGEKVEGNTKGIREIEVRNTRGQHVYTIPKLLTFEQGNMGNQIIGEYELKKDGEWYLISRVPLNWLKEAKLPVVIDPNTTIKADYNAAGVARVDSGKPNTNFYEISNYAQKVSGANHTVFLMQDGTVRTVGYNSSGQLGDGTTVDKSTPVDIGLTGVQGVAGGYGHTVFLMDDGTVRTVGQNDYGQLGDGTTVQKSTPVDIGLTGVQGAAAGYYHTVFLMDDGTVRTVGRNNYGQLGDGTTVDKSTPVDIGLTGVQGAAAGAYHTAFLTDGTVRTVGRNTYGQLGDGTTVDKSTPVDIGLTGVQGVATGGYHTVFLMQDGTVRTVGWNNYGQLGDGTTADKSTPVDIGLTGVQGVAAGFYHTVFLMDDGTMRTVGRNNYGQLGDGTTVDKSTPVDIGLTGVQGVAAEGNYTVFLMQDGTVRTVGQNTYGQLGDGTTVDKSTPVTINIGSTQQLQTLNVSPTEKSLVRFENVPQVGDKAFLALDVVDYNGVFDLVFKKVSGWNGDTVTYNTLPAGSEVKRVDGSKFIVDGVNNHPIWYIDVTDILEDPLDLLIETDNAQAGEFIKFDARSDV